MPMIRSNSNSPGVRGDCGVSPEIVKFSKLYWLIFTRTVRYARKLIAQINGVTVLLEFQMLDLYIAYADTHQHSGH